MTRPGAIYTHGQHRSVLDSYLRRSASNSAGYLLPRLSPSMSLVDVGCGPGAITADLAQAVAPGEVTAVDASSEVLEQAAALFIQRGVTVRTHCADAATTGLPDGCVDVVHAHQVLQHVGDPVAVLGEMRRVCRPGGISPRAMPTTRPSPGIRSPRRSRHGWISTGA